MAPIIERDATRILLRDRLRVHGKVGLRTVKDIFLVFDKSIGKYTCQDRHWCNFKQNIFIITEQNFNFKLLPLLPSFLSHTNLSFLAWKCFISTHCKVHWWAGFNIYTKKVDQAKPNTLAIRDSKRLGWNGKKTSCNEIKKMKEDCKFSSL